MSTNTKPNPASKQPMTFSGLGLESMGDLSALLDTPVEPDSGKPLDLPIDLIDEDPDQPRAADNPGFSTKNMAEIAASIRLRGVKTPISVRDHPTMPGRFMVNHGARRLRGSKMADKTTVPGFIDNDYNHVDQFVENLIRDGYSPREIANYIGRELAKGLEQKAIALAISKSPAWVSQYAALLDLPDPIANVFNEGRITDVTVVNELLKVYKKDSQEVIDWLMDENLELTRGTVKELRDFVQEKSKALVDDSAIAYLSDESRESLSDNDIGSIAQPFDNTGLNNGIIDGTSNDKSLIDNDAIVKTKENVKAADPSKIKKAIVIVEHDGRPARIVLDRRSPSSGVAWLKYNDDGEIFMADLSGVKLMEVIEG